MPCGRRGGRWPHGLGLQPQPARVTIPSMCAWAPRIDLNHEDLFGNEAAEDEPADIFDSYAYERKEVDRFCDPTRAIAIARAYKGEGKSALLRLARTRLAVASSVPPLILESVGPTLSPILGDETNFALWIQQWKRSILELVANRVGAEVGMAWSDDAMGLVELAEKNGFKSRNPVSAILDRLMPQKLKGIATRQRQPSSNFEETLRRWKGTPPDIWLFVDDVDRNFTNTPGEHVRISSLFDACRYMSTAIPSLHFRFTIRPNTWKTIKLRSESLSHVEQYTDVLTWAEEEMLFLLGRRVEGYLARTGQLEQFREKLPSDRVAAARALVNLVFEDPIVWNKMHRPVHVPLYTLSQHRPRWLIELCRVSARRAARRNHARIMRDDIFHELDSFGRRRMDDTIAEFRPQCPQVAEILDAFRGQAEQYRTDELLTLIEKRVVQHVAPTIEGVPGRATHRHIASFLFEMGFIFGRRDFDDGSYEHIWFVDQPSLLVSRTDMDSGLSWEIPPVFRQALDLRTDAGFERPIVPRHQRSKRRIVK